MSLDEIKKVYKKKIKENHPDLKHNWIHRQTPEQANANTKKLTSAMDEIKKSHPKTGPAKPKQTHSTTNPKPKPKPKPEPPKPPQYTARDWANKLTAIFDKEVGTQTTVTEYLKKVVNSPLIKNKAYKEGVSAFLSERIIPFVRNSDDPKTVNSIGSILNQKESVQDIWMKASKDKADFVSRLKKARSTFSTEDWNRLRIKHYSKFFSHLDELTNELVPPQRTTQQAPPRRQETYQGAKTYNKMSTSKSCLRENLAMKAYREAQEGFTQGRGSSIDMTL